MMGPRERERAKQHLKDGWGATIGLCAIGYFGLNSPAMEHEFVWVNVVMVFGMVFLAYAYHLFAVVDIYRQWGIRRRIRSAVRPEVN